MAVCQPGSTAPTNQPATNYPFCTPVGNQGSQFYYYCNDGLQNTGSTGLSVLPSECQSSNTIAESTGICHASA